MDYDTYRFTVLAKTSGKNVHRVNNTLGQIVNCMYFLRKDPDSEMYSRYMRILTKNVNLLNTEFGLNVSADEIVRDTLYNQDK